MGVVAKIMGKISGIASTVAAVTGNPLLAAAFAANSAIMGAIAGSHKPPVLGSVSQITIGANMPTPQIIGRCYYGGNRVTQVAYGTEDKVPNAHAWMVDVHSCGGPLHGLVQAYTDFNAISFTGTNADGYYHNNLHLTYQLGQTPESSQLLPHWSGAPDWGSTYKLSGYAAVGWSARWPKDGKVFASGFPQTGIVWDGVLDYDPRQDSTYPGGSGSHRWADPASKAAFAAAKGTWDYGSGCPGRAALRYALGTWERDETNTSAAYIQTFGMGLPIDMIVVADFVELMNVCDANSWTSNGVLYEPSDTWANLKRILEAGGAEPVWKASRLGLKINAPRVSLDTITWDDIAGPISASAMQSYRERPNTLIPMHRDAGQKWEMAAGSPIQVTAYVTADGGERQQDSPFEFVTGADQAAQLAGYQLVNGREQPLELALKTRCRRFLPGEQYTLASDLAAALALSSANVVVVQRRIDPEAMGVVLNFVTETAAKHGYALGLTGTSPPAVSIVPPEDIDGAITGQPAIVSAQIRSAYITVATGVTLLVGAEVGGAGQITIADHSWEYPNGSLVARTGGTISGLALSSIYFVYFDDQTLSNAIDPPTYVATLNYSEAINSSDNPFRHVLGAVNTPGAGGPPEDGGGGGGGYPGHDGPIDYR